MSYRDKTELTQLAVHAAAEPAEQQQIALMTDSLGSLSSRSPRERPQVPAEP